MPADAPRAMHRSTSSATVSSEPLLGRGAFASVAIDADDEAQLFQRWTALHDVERTFANTLIPERRAAFAAGRQALRAALIHIDPTQQSHPLLSSDRGAPLAPTGFSGSISHKRTRAVAIAADLTDALHARAVGIDLEHRPTDADVSRPSIAKRVLTPFERDAIESLDPLAHREATLTHFAIKEAVYKSIDPFVQRYVHFAEVELDVHDDGTAAVRLLLPELSTTPIRVDAQWRIDEAWIIAIAVSHAR